MGLFDFFKKGKKEDLDEGLSKTRERVFSRLTKAVIGKSTVDDDVLDSIEEILLSSDVGVPTTLKIIDRLQQRVAKDKFINTSELNKLLKDEVAALLTENEKAFGNGQAKITLPKPYVIMVVGVNGVGKTTTIGKLAYQFKQSGRNVIL